MVQVIARFDILLVCTCPHVLVEPIKCLGDEDERDALLTASAKDLRCNEMDFESELALPKTVIRMRGV
jgi:hypothetical protein